MPKAFDLLGRNLAPEVGQHRHQGAAQGDFEAALRKDLLREKLQSAVTGWVSGSVTDQDVVEEYRRRNEKVKLEAKAAAMRTRYDNLRKDLDELKAASGDTWSSLKLSIEKAWNDATNAVNDATDDSDAT